MSLGYKQCNFHSVGITLTFLLFIGEIFNAMHAQKFFFDLGALFTLAYPHSFRGNTGYKVSSHILSLVLGAPLPVQSMTLLPHSGTLIPICGTHTCLEQYWVGSLG